MCILGLVKIVMIHIVNHIKCYTQSCTIPIIENVNTCRLKFIRLEENFCAMYVHIYTTCVCPGRQVGKVDFRSKIFIAPTDLPLTI